MAKFQVAAVFSDHMVLQREKRICVFGEGPNGNRVSVTLRKTQKPYKADTAETKASELPYSQVMLAETVVEQDNWKVYLSPMEAGTGYELLVCCETEQFLFSDVAIGEVWLAGGQSNMEFELQAATGGREVLDLGGNSLVRYYNTPKNSFQDEAAFFNERASSWELFYPETAARWSAVGYFFAERLAGELGVPIGILGCNWGGTSASTWMSREALSEDCDLDSYMIEYEAQVKGKSIEEQIREYDEYEARQTAWQKRADECYAAHPEISWEEVLECCGECPWPGPMNAKNPQRPSGLYECMLKRIQPYTLRGFLYYQGESDDHKPHLYYKLLSRLIYQWREDWEDLTLPFLIVQLPMHRYEADLDRKNWCLIREAQMQVYQTLRNTGIAVILDCGEFNEIHPKNKKPVGERLALSALYEVYHRIAEKEACGPVYAGFECNDHGILLKFHYKGSGFIRKGEMKGFEIAGRDKKYYPANAVMKEKQIFVSASEVPKPQYVRYCWTNYGEVALFGKNGIPVAPFRTSRTDGSDVINPEA